MMDIYYSDLLIHYLMDITINIKEWYFDKGNH